MQAQAPMRRPPDVAPGEKPMIRHRHHHDSQTALRATLGTDNRAIQIVDALTGAILHETPIAGWSELAVQTAVNTARQHALPDEIVILHKEQSR